MIETLEAITIPEPVVIDRGAIAKTRSILIQGRQVLDTNEGLHVIHDRGGETRFIRHCTEPRTFLVVARGYTHIPEDRPGWEIQLGVQSSDFEMAFAFKTDYWREYDFRNDPFIDMIMEYFTAHWQFRRINRDFTAPDN